MPVPFPLLRPFPPRGMLFSEMIFAACSFTPSCARPNTSCRSGHMRHILETGSPNALSTPLCQDNYRKLEVGKFFWNYTFPDSLAASESAHDLSFHREVTPRLEAEEHVEGGSHTAFLEAQWWSSAWGSDRGSTVRMNRGAASCQVRFEGELWVHTWALPRTDDDLTDLLQSRKLPHGSHLCSLGWGRWGWKTLRSPVGWLTGLAARL